MAHSTDSTEQLRTFYNELTTLAGDEAGAQKYIEANFSKLPEEVQGDILVRLYTQASFDEAEKAQHIARIQQKGLEALDVLDALERALKEGD